VTLAGTSTDVWIFQAGSTLTTATGSSVVLTGGAQSCNVYWQVGSSATIGTGSAFKGTILALTSITVTTGVSIDGRVLARNGAVTLDTDTVVRPTCAAAVATAELRRIGDPRQVHERRRPDVGRQVEVAVRLERLVPAVLAREVAIGFGVVGALGHGFLRRRPRRMAARHRSRLTGGRRRFEAIVQQDAPNGW